jgi:hypothetical protein
MKISISMIVLALTALHGIHSYAMPIEDELAMQRMLNQDEHSFNTISWSLNLFHDEIYNEELWTQLTEATKAFIKDSESLAWTDCAYKTSFDNFITLLTETSDASFHGSCTIQLGTALDKNAPTEAHNIENKKTFPSQAIVVNFVIQRPEDAQHWDSKVTLLKEFVLKAQSYNNTGADMKRLSIEVAQSLFDQKEYIADLSVNIIPSA